MAVGGMGMLSTSNYAARKFGVRAAMPGFIGKKLCPDLVIVPLNFTKYKQASKEVQEVFAEYDANFCPMSLDEAYLNVTEYMHKNASRYGFETFEGEYSPFFPYYLCAFRIYLPMNPNKWDK